MEKNDNITRLKTIQKHKGWIYSLVYSPDEMYLLSCSKDKSLRIWNTKEDYAIKQKIEDSSDSIISLAVSPE